MPQFETLLTQNMIDDFTTRGLWPDKTLLDHLDANVARDPQKLAVVDPYGQHTYGELANDVAAASAAMVAHGVDRGDVVGIQLPNGYDWLVVHLAAQRAGAITNALIPIYRDREIGYMAAKAQVKMAFVPQSFRSFDYPAMFARLASDLPDLHTVVALPARDGTTAETSSLQTASAAPTDASPTFTTWEDFLAVRPDAQPDWAARRPGANDLDLVLFTSGTTGSPKGVMHTHNTVGAGSFPWADGLGLSADSVIHMASTFGHLTGYLYGVSLPLILGGTGVYQDIWDVDQFIDWVARYGINHTSGATPFLHDIVRAAVGASGHDLSSLGHFCCMGAPIPRALVAQAKEALPTLAVFGGWGQTECCLVTMTSPDDTMDKITNTDGRALGGMDVRVVDPLNEPVEPGGEGRIQVRGPFLFVGYLGELDKTRAELVDDWFDTGDLATMDAEGYIRLSGRAKDIIVRGGENIPVAYVENVLFEHPAIENAAVVAVPHPRLQEIACAVLTLLPGESMDLADLQRFLESKGVAKQYWPEQVQVVPDFPRTPSGKIQKYKLREEFGADRVTAG